METDPNLITIQVRIRLRNRKRRQEEESLKTGPMEDYQGRKPSKPLKKNGLITAHVDQAGLPSGTRPST